jgi:hypothetical protein
MVQRIKEISLSSRAIKNDLPTFVLARLDCGWMISCGEVSNALLVERLLAGDESAFDTIYARHAPSLMAAYRRQEDDKAEQVVQQTFFRAVRAMLLVIERRTIRHAAEITGNAANTLGTRAKRGLRILHRGRTQPDPKLSRVSQPRPNSMKHSWSPGESSTSRA